MWRAVALAEQVAEIRIGWGWVEGMKPGSAAATGTQFEAGSASPACVRAPTAGAPGRRANRDRRRRSKTYRKGTCPSFDDTSS
jgi:hypothetical protein